MKNFKIKGKKKQREEKLSFNLEDVKKKMMKTLKQIE